MTRAVYVVGGFVLLSRIAVAVATSWVAIAGRVGVVRAAGEVAVTGPPIGAGTLASGWPGPTVDVRDGDVAVGSVVGVAGSVAVAGAPSPPSVAVGT